MPGEVAKTITDWCVSQRSVLAGQGVLQIAPALGARYGIGMDQESGPVPLAF